jgi:nucleotide-binding universal stress UspA family protein
VFRNILVAIDSSPASERALEEARDLAQVFNARLTIISVAAQVPGLAYRAGVNVQAMEEEAETETDKLLRAAVDGLPEGLPVTTVHKRGHAGDEIVKQIEAGEHDLLVMGSRGLGRVATNLFGSVGAHVHYHSRVAMLVVQPEE